MTKNNSKHSTWKDVDNEYTKFLEVFPKLKQDKKVITTLKTMSLWSYESRLKEENRYVELTWIQPNLIEISINSLLSVYFLTVNGKKKNEEHDNLINSLNLQHKIKLLYSLNLIDKKLYLELESYRSTRNNLIHKLMKQIRIGKDIDKECKRFCISGFKLQDLLHDILMEFVRQQMK